MMKMNITIRGLACSMALAATLLCTSKAAAQSQFVITDGSNKWLDRVGSTWTEDNRAVMNGTWAEFHKLVPSPEETRLVNRKGTHYVALDTASNNLSITPSTVLTPFCVWQRTGNTGYYYQEHVDNVSGKTYRYYLIASKAAGVSINRIEVGEDLNNITKWYDWEREISPESPDCVWDTERLFTDTFNNDQTIIRSFRAKTDRNLNTLNNHADNRTLCHI